MLKKPGLLIGAVLLLCGASFAVFAADTGPDKLKIGGAIKADPSAAPAAAAAANETTVDLRRIPIIQTALQNGAELYYLGERSGMHGFLLYKDGRVQIVYLTPDQKSVVFGGMYSSEGVDVTSAQIGNAGKENAQLKALLAAASEQQREIERLGMGSYGPQDQVQQQAAKTSMVASVPLSPGERLMSDFINAAGVTVGQDGKPLVLMLVDPQCQFCKATWKELYEPITKGVLRVKLVPIGAEGSENEKQAARFLRVSDPLNSWNKFVNGDKDVLAGDPATPELLAVRATMGMVLSWKIQATPYLVYRGSDGRVKVVQGKPDKIATVLADLKQP